MSENVIINGVATPGSSVTAGLDGAIGFGLPVDWLRAAKPAAGSE